MKKSLTDFKEAIQYGITYKMIPVTDDQGKVRYKKQRAQRLVLTAKSGKIANTDVTATPEYAINSSTIQAENINEAIDTNDPPYVLILKRQSVRLFPNNTKVALYYNDKLNKTFSIPYGPKINSVIQAESVLSDLSTITENTTLYFESGDDITISKKEATKILELYDNLSEENKLKLLNKLCESKTAFTKIINFSLYKK